MEGTVFHASAVAEIMKKHFVESRMHTDAQNTLTEEQFAANRKARDEIAGVEAMPYFVVVDAKSGKKIAEHSLSAMTSEGLKDEWLVFLERVLVATGRADH